MPFLVNAARVPAAAAAIALLLLPPWVAASPPAATELPRVDFNRDVRPILSDKCYRCHGPDEGERKAKLRLDRQDGIFAGRPAGSVVVPGKSEESLVYAKISAKLPDDRMPPPGSGKTLTDAEIDLIRRWIDQGAEWRGHWAFIAPRRPPTPPPIPPSSAVSGGREPARNPIDSLLRARLKTAGLEPSPPADGAQVARRVTLDLTGLPPAIEEVDAFLAGEAADAYERLVDRLLASPRHGEHMARYWLDAVRYGDTHGLHFDNERSLWPYRDWVTRAFNAGKPFDAFTVEQLAGDLLPGATAETRIATGFNRCNVSTSEGGSIDEEVLVRYGVDRVEATGTVWLGLTVGCAVCHDHKFDPISQKEFYQLFAFFNSFEENAMDGNALLPPPYLKVPSPELDERIASLRGEAQAVRARLDDPLPEADAAQEKWAAALAERLKGIWRVVEPSRVASTGGAGLRKLEDGSFLAEGASPEKDVYEILLAGPSGPITAIRLEALQLPPRSPRGDGQLPPRSPRGDGQLPPRSPRGDGSQPPGGPGRADNGNFVLTEVEASVTFPAVAGGEQRPAQGVSFLSAQADYSQKDFEIAKAIDGKLDTGWAVDGPTPREDRTAVFFPARPIEVEEGALLRLRLVQDHGARHTIGRFRVSIANDASLAPPLLGPWSVVGPFQAASGDEAFAQDYGPEARLDLAADYAGGKLKWAEKPDLADGKVHAFGQEVGATYLHRLIRSSGARKMMVSLGSDDGLKLWLNGKLVLERRVQRGVAPDQDQAPLDLAAGDNHLLLKVVNFGGAAGFFFRRLGDDSQAEIIDIGAILAIAPDLRSEGDRKRLRDYYRGKYSSEWQSLQARAGELEKQAQETEARIPGTLVTREMEKRRDAFVLIRGEYTQKGQQVSPGVPAVLPPLGEGEPANRLGLARWLVRPDHPLTARVTVNRFWQQYFGAGIVKTAVDFGAQGEWPVHPDLLDWLAVELVESGWDVKRLERRIVLSAAYRQDSRVTPLALEKDPENRLLARGPRFRLDAEVLRDTALWSSGLLVERLGGPSVKPYQPGGIWEAVGFVGSNTSVFKADQDQGLYRRGLYTFWKRTAPPPALSLFDAPSRETCTALRPRTNTPLQALAMMNDVQFFEASRRLAERMLREGGAAEERIAYAFRLLTARRPRADELEVLLETYRGHLEEYRSDVDAARQVVSVGASKPDASLDVSELAACTMVASLILNLDETLTKG